MEARNDMVPPDEFSPDSPGRPRPMPAPELCEYFLCQSKAIYGPVELTTIARWVGEGRVSTRDWVFVPTLCDWMPILEVPDMAGCFYNVVDKPIGPPPGLPVEVYLKYYKKQDEHDPNAAATLKMVEKRQWVRIPLTASMTFWEVKDIKDENPEKHDTTTVNISEGGIGFEWTAPLEDGLIIEMRIDFFPVTLHAQARVAHSVLKDDLTYMVGVSFRNLATSERDKIRHFIRTCLHTASRGVPGNR